MVNLNELGNVVVSTEILWLYVILKSPRRAHHDKICLFFYSFSQIFLSQRRHYLLRFNVGDTAISLTLSYSYRPFHTYLPFNIVDRYEM